MRTGRAKMLAGSTTYTGLDVDDRNLQRLGIIGILRHHLDGVGRTMAFAIAAALSLGIHDAEVFQPHRMANLDGRFLRLADRLDGSRRANLRALRTLRTAIATLVGHGGLHQREQIARWAQHVVLAHRHTQLATRAVPRQIAKA